MPCRFYLEWINSTSRSELAQTLVHRIFFNRIKRTMWYLHFSGYNIASFYFRLFVECQRNFTMNTSSNFIVSIDIISDALFNDIF